MEKLFDPTSLSELFVPTVPLLEAFLRGTIVYLALFTILRFLAKRGSVASASLTDLLVLVLVTNAVQNAVAADYNSGRFVRNQRARSDSWYLVRLSIFSNIEQQIL